MTDNPRWPGGPTLLNLVPRLRDAGQSEAADRIEQLQEQVRSLQQELREERQSPREDWAQMAADV
jgi:hypothetical protein